MTRARFNPGLVALCVVLLVCLGLGPQGVSEAMAASSDKWGKLFVETAPQGASVRFLRVKLRYKPGMVLEKGNYLLEITKAGYDPLLKEVQVLAGQDNVVQVNLRGAGQRNGIMPDNRTSTPVPPKRQTVEPEKDLRIPISAPQETPSAPTSDSAIAGMDQAVSPQETSTGPMPRPRRQKTEAGAAAPEPDAPATSAESRAVVDPLTGLAPGMSFSVTKDKPQPAAEDAGVQAPFSATLGPESGDAAPVAIPPEPEPFVPPVETAPEQTAQEPGLPPIDANNPPSPEELMQVGNHLTQAGDLPNAIQAFTFVIQQQPKNVNAYVGRGFAYYKLGNYAFTIEDMTQALNLDATHLSAWFHRGNAWLLAGDYEKAKEDYEQALLLAQNVPDIFNAHGTALYNLGDLDNAIKDFSMAITLDEGYVDAYYNRGSAYLKQGKPQLALDDFNKVLSLVPGDALAQEKKRRAEKELLP